MFLKLKNPTAKRLYEVRKALGLSQRAFAETLGVTQTTIMRWEQGSIALSKGTQALLEQTHNVSLEWLEIGEGSMFTKDTAHKPWQTGGCNETVAIPYANGGGSYIVAAQWPRDRIGISPESLVAIRIDGDSMIPTFAPNDIVIIDKSAPSLDFTDGVWAFKIENALHVKRIQHKGRGFQAISDNRDYPPFDLEQPYQLIGRVVWSDRRW